MEATSVKDQSEARAFRGAVTRHLDLRGPRRRGLGQERYIADTFCTRAAGRVNSNVRQVEQHDDDRMTAIAKLAYKPGNYD